jgi:hypothetical protein
MKEVAWFFIIQKMTFERGLYTPFCSKPCRVLNTFNGFAFSGHRNGVKFVSPVNFFSQNLQFWGFFKSSAEVIQGTEVRTV